MEYRQLHHELTNQLHNPLKRFSEKNERLHVAEDNRLFPSHNISSIDVIEKFVTYRSDALEKSIPRRHQALKDYLTEATNRGDRPSTASLEDDIVATSSNSDIALLDDRRKHPKCHGSTCTNCSIYSAKIRIPGLYTRLKEKVSILQSVENRPWISLLTLVLH